MLKVDKKTFGKYIKTKREEAGIEQKTLADKLSVTRDAISKWENGKRYPDLEMLDMLAQALGISVQDIIDNSKIEVKDHKYLEVISIIALCSVMFGGAILGLIRNSNNYYRINGIYKNEKGIYEIDSKKLSDECSKLQGEKIGRVQLPNSINVATDVRPCSFDADIKANKEIELDRLIKAIYGGNYSITDFELNAMDGVYYDPDGILMHISNTEYLEYVRQLEPIKWQFAYCGTETEYTTKIEKNIQNVTMKKYRSMLNEIRDLYYSEDYFYILEADKIMSFACDNSVVDYFDIYIVYNDIPINNINKRNNSSQVYNFYISFLDEDKIGSLYVDKYFGGPDNIEYYEKIMSLYNATEILNNYLNKNTKVSKVDLVYARSRDVGALFKADYNRFYPFWRFEIKSDNQTYFVNAITGELY